MVRAIFLVLFLANLFAFAWVEGYVGHSNAGHEPERLQNQFLQERLQVSVETIAPEPAVPLVCRRVGPLADEEADALGKKVAAQGGRVSRDVIEASGYWLYIPSQDGKYPEKAVDALRRAGFKRFSVIEEAGPNRNAISFGDFSSEDAARERMDTLTRNHIESVKLAEVRRPTGKVMLIARGEAAQLTKVLAGMQAEEVKCPPRM